MTCTFAHKNTGREDQESALNEELNKAFPAENVNGVNSHYLYMVENREFLDWFGDWTGPKDGYNELVDETQNTGIFNKLGEPRLQYDVTGNGYILNSKGQRKYLKPLFETVSSLEVNSVVNTLTGDFIQDTASQYNLERYINTKFDSEVANLEKSIAAGKNAVSKIKIKDASDIKNSRKKRSRLRLIINMQLKLNKLKSIQESPNLKALIQKRILARLENYNFKYTEDAQSKDTDIEKYNEIANFTLDSNETSNRAVNDPVILSFLSSVPLFKNYNKKLSEQEPEVNKLLNSVQYMEQSEVWNQLEEIFAGVLPTSANKDVFLNFVTAVKNLAEDTEQPELNFISEFLENIDERVENPDGFKTKFVAAFFKSNQNYLITQVSRAKVNGKYVTTFKIIDPAVKSNKTGKLSNEYIETVTNSKTLTSKYDFNNLRKKLLEGYDLPDGTHVKGFNDIKAKANQADYYSFLDEMLNSQLGLNISPAVIRHYMKMQTKNSYQDLRESLEKFISKNVTSKAVEEYTPIEMPKGELGILAELRLLENDRGRSADAKDAFKTYLMSNNSFLKGVAQAAKPFSRDVSETSFMVGGSQRWAYSYTSGLNLEIGKWKNGILDSLHRLKDRGLQFVSHLLNEARSEERIEMLEIYTNSEIKNEMDANPSLHKKITEIDYHWDNFAKGMNSHDKFYENSTDKRQNGGIERDTRLRNFKNYVMYNFGADKNSLFAIYGLPVLSDGKQMYSAKKKELGVDLKEMLNNYVIGELKLAKKAGEMIDGYFNQETPEEKQKYLMEHLVPDYHYKTDKNIETEELNKEDFKAGNYHKVGIFTSSLARYIKENPGDSQLVYNTTSGYPVVNGSFFKETKIRKNKSLAKLMGYVFDDINQNIQENYEYLNDITLIKKENDEGEIEEVKLFEVESNMRTGEMDMTLYNYIISSFLNNYELSNMLNGHVSYYKQSDPTDIKLTDFLKRAPAIATDGKYLRHRQTGEAKTYLDYQGNEKVVPEADDKIIVAVMNNIEVKVSKNSKLISKATGQKLTFKHELADAQGYASAEHFRELITRIYGWEAIDDQMYNELTDPNHKVTDANIRWIKKSSKAFTPLKMVHFEVNDRGIPVYLKYSVAPLFPAMTSGTEMQIIADQMKKQGVEQVVFKSGSKASNNAPTTVHNMDASGNYDGVSPTLKFNPFEIDSSKTKMQVEMPTKLDKETALGMQSLKNILTNLDLSDPVPAYKYRDEILTAQEVYDRINETAVEMLQNQLNKVLSTLGYKDGTFDRNSVKNLLINQMDIETESDLIYLLKSDLPLEAIPNFSQRAFPVVASFLNKKAGKIYTNGGSVVQVANVGYDRLTQEAADGVFYFGEQTELTPPLPETDADGNINYYGVDGELSTKKDGGKMRIEKAKILLPFASIMEKTGLSYNEFKELWKKGLIDKEIFSNIMGYRIPNQSMSSNDSFEIVGILPAIAGDQAIVYHEITAKTGSDFDIDKMYLAMPNFHVKSRMKLTEGDFKKYKGLRDMLTGKLPGVMKNMQIEYEKPMDIYEDFLSDERIRDIIEPGYNKHHQPLRAILEKQDEILDILEEKDIILEDGPDGAITLLEVMEDLITSYSIRAQALNEERKKSEDKAGEFFDLNKFREINGVTYVKEGHKGLQNEFIELMNSILESGNSYNDLMSPLDNDIIKDTIHEVDYLKDLTEGAYVDNPALSYEENMAEHTRSKVETGMTQMFPVSLLKSRVDVLEAKTLISIMANNMTDLGESQKVDFGLQYPLGIVNDKGTRSTSLARTFLLNQAGDDSGKLSKIVSYLMNASVDAAKDNYIISGNFTSYTANGAMLMTRLGMPLKDLFTVLMNKEVMDFSRYKNYQKAKLSDFSFDYNQEKLDEWSKSLLKKLKENDWNIFNVVSREDFLGNNTGKKEDILGYWNLIQTVGKEFNDSIVAMKSDSNGAGRSIPDFVSQKNRITKVMNSTISNSGEKWFKDGFGKDNKNMKFNPEINKNPNAKILGAMANNTMFLMEELSKDLFLETTENVQKAVNVILTGLGTPLETDVSNIKLIYNYLYPYILRQTGHKLYDIDQAREEYLLKDFPRKLQLYRMENKNNGFLNQLDISTNKKRNLIKFPNFKNFAVQDKLNFKEALTEVMNDPAVEDPSSLFYGLMDDLVQYSFLTTGFKSTHFSFNDYLPASYFLNTMHGKAVQDTINTLNDPTRNNINYVEALTEIAKAHHTNYKIVKKLSIKLKGDELGNPIRSEVPISNKKTLDKLSIGDNAYAPFFKKSKTLFMLTGKLKGNPIYEQINKSSNKDFDTFAFYDTDKGLSLDDPAYISPASKLYTPADKNLNTTTTEANKPC